MRRAMLCAIALAGVLIGSSAYAVTAEDGPAAVNGLVPPPAINIPYGGKVITEINFSDNDVLGLLKQFIPVAWEAARQLGGDMKIGGAAKRFDLGPVMQSVDIWGLMEAIDGVKSVRVVVAKYNRPMDPVKIADQFSKGVAKIGTFSKVASHAAFSPGTMALYAEPNNAGYIGCAYQPSSRTLYAVRVVGFVDVPKLTQWGLDLTKKVMEIKPTPAEPAATERPAEPSTDKAE